MKYVCTYPLLGSTLRSTTMVSKSHSAAGWRSCGTDAEPVGPLTLTFLVSAACLWFSVVAVMTVVAGSLRAGAASAAGAARVAEAAAMVDSFIADDNLWQESQKGGRGNLKRDTLDS